jgi:DNA-binding transcriptional LysR family regulator
LNGLNLDQLRAFVGVVELGSFSAAAERLGVTQPAVSMQVRQLEKRLGVQLIERVGRRAKASAAGHELLLHAARIEAAVSQALEAVAPHSSGATGRVRIGTGATACIFLLPPLLRELRQRHPGVEITVTTGNTADIVKAIDDNRLDVGLVTLPLSGRSLHVVPVLDDEFVAIAPREIGLPQRVSAAALAERPLLLYEPGGNTRRIADQWLAKAATPLRPVMSLGSVEAIKQMVGAGLGCSILPQMAVRGEMASGALVVRSLTPRLKRRLALVLRRDKRLHRALADTVHALQRLGVHPAPPAHTGRKRGKG